VLLAEDNPVNQLVAKAMLENVSAEVGLAADGLQAVEMASEDHYHVILMDLQMPGMDGIAATREIRLREQHAARRPIPIIAMTGNSPEDYGEACRQSGMDGFLTKPVTLNQLTSVLGRLDLAIGPPDRKEQ
jgi:CheY-like chemotaxis protein